MQGGVQLDFEWAVGHRWKHVGVSFAMRVVWEAYPSIVTFWIPTETVVAFFPTGRDWGFTWGFVLGSGYPYTIYIATSVGLTVQL